MVAPQARHGRRVEDSADKALVMSFEPAGRVGLSSELEKYAFVVVRSTATWAVHRGRALWNGRTLRDWSASLAADLVDAFHPVEIWLFGSVARGDDGASSDLDVLVVLDAYDPARSIELKQRAQRTATVPAPFDASFTDVARVAARRHVAGTLERAVDLEGELLYRRG